jgi:hypothetical protein
MKKIEKKTHFAIRKKDIFSSALFGCSFGFAFER